MQIEQAVAVLETFEFYMDGGVRRAPEANEFDTALKAIKNALGIVPPPATIWGDKFEIRSKDRKHRGQVYAGQPTGMFAEISKDRQQIRLSGAYWSKTVDITFKVGDMVEYDSYNLRYLGTIQSITEKRVLVKPRYGSGNKSMDLNGFAWRNHNFNLEQAHAENAETSMYI